MDSVGKTIWSIICSAIKCLNLMLLLSILQIFWWRLVNCTYKTNTNNINMSTAGNYTQIRANNKLHPCTRLVWRALGSGVTDLSINNSRLQTVIIIVFSKQLNFYWILKLMHIFELHANKNKSMCNTAIPFSTRIRKINSLRATGEQVCLVSEWHSLCYSFYCFVSSILWTMLWPVLVVIYTTVLCWR